MFNVEGNWHDVHCNGLVEPLTVISSVPGYAVLDVINFRLYNVEPSGSLVIQGQRFARKSDHDYSRCELEIQGYSLTAIRKLTARGKTYALSMPGTVRCKDASHPCVESSCSFMIVSDLGGDDLLKLATSLFICKPKG